MQKQSLPLHILSMLFFLLCMTSPLRASIVFNENFSNGLSGWSTQGNVIATDYANMPLQYKNNWDLSSWNSKMDGTFALLSIGGMGKNFVGNVSGSDKLSFTYDYAIAWEKLNSDDSGYAYFNVFMSGETDSGSRGVIFSTERPWGGENEKGVDIGTIYAQIAPRNPDLNFTKFYLEFSLTGHPLNQIVCIDNINLQATPVPLPSSILLIGSALVGLIGLRRKFQR